MAGAVECDACARSSTAVEGCSTTTTSSTCPSRTPTATTTSPRSSTKTDSGQALLNQLNRVVVVVVVVNRQLKTFLFSESRPTNTDRDLL